MFQNPSSVLLYLCVNHAVFSFITLFFHSLSLSPSSHFVCALLTSSSFLTSPPRLLLSLHYPPLRLFLDSFYKTMEPEQHGMAVKSVCFEYGSHLESITGLKGNAGHRWSSGQVVTRWTHKAAIVCRCVTY